MTSGHCFRSGSVLHPVRNIATFNSSTTAIISLSTYLVPLNAGFSSGKPIPHNDAPSAIDLATCRPFLIPPVPITGKVRDSKMEIAVGMPQLA